MFLIQVRIVLYTIILLHITYLVMLVISHQTNKRKQTPWPESASELYRPRDHHLSAKLLPTFADNVVPRGQRDGSLHPYSRISRPEPLLLLSSSSSIVLTRLWNPFQSSYFSENLVGPGIEPGPLDL
jgi:hypothetical protein